MLKSYKSILVLAVLSIFSILIITGCSASRTPEVTPTPAATAVPPTPTTAPAEIIWVNTQATANDAVAGVINDFAAANSLQVRSLSTLDSSNITGGTKIVVITGTGIDFNSLASAAPAVQFILLGSANSNNLSNISTIQANSADEAFMAGYLTELIAWDWRGAALLPSDDAAYANAFENGSRFLCGSCAPYYAPIVKFPVLASEPAGSPSTTWLTDTGNLNQYWLSVAFVTPSAVSADVIASLGSRTYTNSVTFISTTAAPQDGSVAWAALLDSDFADPLKIMLPQVLSGKGNLNARAQISLTSVNSDIVSPARLDMFNKTAADLAADLINPVSVP
jgi:hypothetical protein